MDYLHLGRRGWQQLDRATRAELRPDSAVFMLANNLTARSRYAELVDEHLTAHLRRPGGSLPVFWVTLVDRRFTLSLRESRAFDPRPLRKWVREALWPCHCIGVIEAALYTSSDRGGYRRALSWHTHLVVWGITAADLDARCEEVNRRHRTFVPGLTAAHWRPVSLARITALSCYMLKAPFTEYRVWQPRGLGTDVSEATRASGRWQQRKREARPGDMVRLCRVFAGRTLDGLIFGLGDGRDVLARINGAALAPCREWELRTRLRAE